MTAPAAKIATYEDLLALPEDVRAELLGGVLSTTPAPLPQHSRAQRSLSRFVGGPFDDDDDFGGPGGWWILVEVDIRLTTHDVVRPDVAGWRRTRLPNPTGLRPIEVVPDWVCEILSPSTAARDKVTKSDLYRRQGVAHYWIVDVEARTLEAFELSDDHWVLSGSYDETHTAAIVPFEAIELPVGRLFLPPI